MALTIRSPLSLLIGMILYFDEVEILKMGCRDSPSSGLCSFSEKICIVTFELSPIVNTKYNSLLRLTSSQSELTIVPPMKLTVPL